MSNKFYIHVVLPDGSAVERCTARPYRFAVCRKGAGQEKAHRQLGDELRNSKRNLAERETRLHVLTEGLIISQEPGTFFRGDQNAPRYQVFTIGGLDALSGVTERLTVYGDESFNDRLKKEQGYHKGQVEYLTKRIEEITAALEFIETKAHTYRVTTEDAAVYTALGYYRPGVFGFSQTRKSAESRARTEARRNPHLFTYSDTYVREVTVGKTPKDALKGLRL